MAVLGVARSAVPASQSASASRAAPRREVAEAVRTRAARCLILAPNIGRGVAGGRLDGLMAALLGQAGDCAVPVVYALPVEGLGRVRADCPDGARFRVEGLARPGAGVPARL